jgi:CRP/FNR family transcriptional regulator, cyclic AMP receptor protein
VRIAARKGELVRKHAALAFDPKTFLGKIDSGKSTREYRSRQVVFSQGDAADAVFYIQGGKVKLTVVSTRGKEAVIGVLEPGSFFGEGCLAAQPLRMATASAIQPSRIVRVGRSTMVRLLHREPEFAELFIAYLLSRNVRIEEDLVDQLFNSSEKRLARILLLLAHFGKEPRPESVIPKVSQETLAAMVGTTRSRMSYFMNRFRKLGFIHYNGGLQVHSALLTVVLRD